VVAASTVNRELNVLKAMLAKAVQWKLLDMNPSGEVKRFAVNDARLRYLGIGRAPMARTTAEVEFPQAAIASFFFRRQGVHLLYLVALLPVAWALATPALGRGVWLGLTDTSWFALSVGVAVVHQVFVWIAWRAQLGWTVFTRVFGEGDFAVYSAVFFPLLVLRIVLVLAISMADAGSLRLPAGLALGLGTLLAVPALYTGWSVERYFGFLRAAGGDHFRRRFREMPLVREGAFVWTPNAMYTLAFLGLWSIALIARSHAGLVAALFQHGYIWVHYLCTEEPDMNVLYGSRATVS
jgi:Phospholipid methyltransferase